MKLISVPVIFVAAASSACATESNDAINHSKARYYVNQNSCHGETAAIATSCGGESTSTCFGNCMKVTAGITKDSVCEDYEDAFGMCADKCTEDDVCKNLVLDMLTCKMAEGDISCSRGGKVAPKLRGPGALTLADVMTDHQDEDPKLGIKTKTGTSVSCAATRIRVDYYNRHRDQETRNIICWKSAGYGWPANYLFEYCEVPHDRRNWRPTYHWITFCDSQQQEYGYLENTGDDAWLVDQVVTEWCAAPTSLLGCWTWFDDGEIGSNNNVGWCLSTDSGDASGFGNQAYQGTCKNRLYIKPFTEEWYW